MKVLEKAEINDWFSKYPKGPEYVQYDGRDLYFVHPEANCIDLEYPKKLEQLPFMARLLAAVGYDPQHFAGALIFLTDWGVWNSADEATGYRIVEAMRSGAGQPRSFEAAPGQRFRADEMIDAIAMLLQPMIFGWDAFYLPRWAYGCDEFFLFVSHDSFVTVVSRTKEFHQRIFKDLQGLDFFPEPGNELRVRRFCRDAAR